MKPSEIVKELAKEVHSYVNEKIFDGRDIPIASIHLMLANWLIDHSVSL